MTQIAKNRHKAFKRQMALLLCLLFSILGLSSLKLKTEDEIPNGIYQLKYPSYFGNRVNLNDANPLTQQSVYLGRRLFYEVRLSADNSLSCGSCHQQAKAFTDGLKLSKGVDRSFTGRNTMALVNLLWSRRFFWDGRSASLEDQASFPMVNPHEMGQSLQISVKKLKATNYYPSLFKAVFGDEKITAERIVAAIAQFERTLISSDSKYDRYLNGSAQLNDDETRGMMLFNTSPNPQKGIRGANCAHCHGGAKNYLELFHNNGLDSIYADKGMAAFTGIKTDHGRFKVPTLRNIALTSPYMHDGRFATLEEVVEHYSERVKSSEALSAFLQNQSNERGAIPVKLNAAEKKDLIAFLNTLTDDTFVNDPKFSNPFVNP